MIALAVGLGTVILVGGAERFSGPNFNGAHALTDWLPLFPAHVYWGSLFMLYGGALILSLGRTIAVHTLRFGMVVYLFFAVSFAMSLHSEPKAALTAVVAYTIFFGIHTFLSDHLAHHHVWAEC